MLNEKLNIEFAPLNSVNVECITCTKYLCTFITGLRGHRDVTYHVENRRPKAAKEALSSASKGNRHREETAWRW